MLSILGALPIIGNVVTGITSAVFNAKVKIAQARIGGDRDVAVEVVRKAAIEDQARATSLAAIAGSKLLTVLVVAFALPLVIFVWKVVVWDIVLGLGSTDPIRGQVAEWGNQIVWFIFGAPTALSLGKLWFNSRSQG